jgi:hypothetical protein
MTSSAISLPLVMKDFSSEITYDEENLLTMSKENLRVVLEKRANDKIEREKQIAIEAKEQERKRIIEAQKQEQLYLYFFIFTHTFLLFFIFIYFF